MTQPSMNATMPTGPFVWEPDGPIPDPDDPGGLSDLFTGGLTDAIESFFRQLVTDALNPLLELLGRTLLTTPSPELTPRITELWEQSRLFVVAAYVLVVLIAGITMMAYENVQTRYGVKEILPRLVVGFLAANLSLPLATRAIAFANAASTAVLGDGMDPDQAAEALTELVLGSLGNHGVFLILIGLAVVVLLVVLLLTYVIRVALTVMLIVVAPLALACHGLPQTEPVALWWWRAFAAVLTIQLGQSLALVTFLRVFLDADGFSLFGGATPDGLMNLLVCTALFWLLIKIPFWAFAHLPGRGGRSMVGGLIKGFVAYKTFGLLRGGTTGAAASAAGGGRGGYGGLGPRHSRPHPPGGGNGTGSRVGRRPPSPGSPTQRRNHRPGRGSRQPPGRANTGPERSQRSSPVSGHRLGQERPPARPASRRPDGRAHRRTTYAGADGVGATRPVEPVGHSRMADPPPAQAAPPQARTRGRETEPPASPDSLLRGGGPGRPLSYRSSSLGSMNQHGRIVRTPDPFGPARRTNRPEAIGQSERPPVPTPPVRRMRLPHDVASPPPGSRSGHRVARDPDSPKSPQPSSRQAQPSRWKAGATTGDRPLSTAAKAVQVARPAVAAESARRATPSAQARTPSYQPRTAPRSLPRPPRTRTRTGEQHGGSFHRPPGLRAPRTKPGRTDRRKR